MTLHELYSLGIGNRLRNLMVKSGRTGNILIKEYTKANENKFGSMEIWGLHPTFKVTPDGDFVFIQMEVFCNEDEYKERKNT